MTESQRYESFVSAPDLFLDHSVTSKTPFLTDPNIHSQTSSTKHQIFGKRMEEYFLHYIEQHSDYDLVMHGLQIIENKTTLGELDFLVQERATKQALHIELVTKFYLYDPDINGELERWIGPNRKDTLVQKLDKLGTKQFPIIHHPATQNELLRLGLYSPSIQQQLCFKALLFIPVDQAKKTMHINQDCIVGTWLSMSQFREAKYASFEFHLPEKLDWYCSPSDNNTWIGHCQALEEIQTEHNRKRSPLVWIKKSGTQFERCFVVWW